MKTLKDFKNIIDRISDNGLDLTRYTIVGAIPQKDGEEVIIEHSNELEHPHWCIRYRGGGHYFTTAAELMDYYSKRRFANPDAAEQACMEFIEENKLGLIEGMKARDKNGWHVGWSKVMTMVEVPKWISVEERFPLHDQDVLVLTAPGTLSLGQNMLVATYIHPRNEQYGVFINFYAGYDDKNILTVTHWMPMPELPEEDE